MQEINIKDQVEFISGMQGRFNIFELFNVFDLKKMIKEIKSYIVTLKIK